MFCLPPNFQITKNEMGGECSVYGKREEHAKFSWGNRMERDHLDGTGIEGSIILK